MPTPSSMMESALKYDPSLAARIPTDFAKTLIQAGLQPGRKAFQPAMTAQIAKQNEMTGYRPGSFVPDGKGGMISLPAAPPTGSYYTQTPKGLADDRYPRRAVSHRGWQVCGYSWRSCGNSARHERQSVVVVPDVPAESVPGADHDRRSDVAPSRRCADPPVFQIDGEAEFWQWQDDLNNTHGSRRNFKREGSGHFYRYVDVRLIYIDEQGWNYLSGLV